MRVKIGPYTKWFGPYQMASLLCFWAKDVEDEYGMKSEPDWVHSFGEWLAHGNTPDESDKPRSERIYKDRPVTWLYKLLLWIDGKKKRKVSVHIDKWDTWSMDQTLAMIILPMLYQLQATKHGSPHVDDEDVPEHLRSTTAQPKQNEWDTDGNWHARWEWVLEEIIWAFEQHQPGCDWESKYYSGESDTYWEVSKTDENGKPKLYEMKEGPDSTRKADYEGMEKHQARINNGFRLFGKYYQGLWD